jgi:hypothetical protein
MAGRFRRGKPQTTAITRSLANEITGQHRQVSGVRYQSTGKRVVVQAAPTQSFAPAAPPPGKYPSSSYDPRAFDHDDVTGELPSDSLDPRKLTRNQRRRRTKAYKVCSFV